MNGILTYIIPSIIILYAIYFMIIDRSIFAISLVPYTHEYVHSFSLICFVFSYILFQRALKHITIVTRTVVSFLLIAIHGYFGGFLWDLNNFAINGVWNIMFLIDVTVIVWLYLMLLRLNRNYPILKKKLSTSDKIKTFSLFLLQGLGYVALWLYGFWNYFGNTPLYSATDPNANIFWLFMRTTTFFLFYYLIQKGTEENYEIEAPRF